MLDETIPLQTKGLYSILVCLCGARDYCYPGVEYLMRVSQMSRATVYRHLQDLEDRGLIRRAYDPSKKKIITRNLAFLSHNPLENNNSND
jgi:DNA-binding MarR family transcriptional regulator